MKRIYTTLFFGLILLTLGCTKDTDDESNTDSNREIYVKVDGKEISFRPSYSAFASFRRGLILKESDITNKADRKSAVVHRIYLANYDLGLTDPRNQDYRRIDSEGQVRIEIQIEAEEGSGPEASPQGEYEYKPKPYGRISYVFISYMKNGRDRGENLQTKDFAGKIKLTSINDDAIEGEIDVLDKDKFVKGEFKAKRLNQQDI